MYSDTHFHFVKMCEGDESRGADFFRDAAAYNPFFMMDIGTKCDDLAARISFVEKSLSLLGDAKLEPDVRRSLFFTAGIWPSAEEIRDRENCVRELERQIAAFQDNSRGFHKLAAVGECGLDHHWNKAGVDSRDEADFDKDTLEGERELFIMQMALARKLNLPVVVHSRDAFEDTISCMDEADFGHGIVHCYSYGKDEAKAFLDRGWHIALGGAVTYTKKRNMDAMADLIRFIPEDRLLLETDAPYLAPVPMRGKPNTPLYIRHTYEFIAGIRGVTVEDLCRTVDDNCGSLFKDAMAH
ncbi:MAG: TatD family hydrolase [Treponema sp.]|nr:TatD family hydrolase [Treponema sp.]